MPQCLCNMSFKLLYEAEASPSCQAPNAQPTVMQIGRQQHAEKSGAEAAENPFISVRPFAPHGIMAVGPLSTLVPVGCHSSANNNSLEELPDLRNLTDLQRL